MRKISWWTYWKSEDLRYNN